VVEAGVGGAEVSDNLNCQWSEAAPGSIPNPELTWEKLREIFDQFPPPPVFLLHPDRLPEVAEALHYHIPAPTFERPAQRKMFDCEGVRFVVCPIFPKAILQVEDRQLIETLLHEFENGIQTGLIEELWAIRKG
jgi:hypothetical protein